MTKQELLEKIVHKVWEARAYPAKRSTHAVASEILALVLQYLDRAGENEW